jgi:hypothetical protein
MPGWIEQEQRDRKLLTVTPAREQELENTKKEVLPIIAGEAEQGMKPFETIKFQPVKSPGLFEAQFAKKEGAIIFQFWPWGYHAAEREGRPLPPFTKQFREKLQPTLAKTFEDRFLRVEEVRQMGAYYVEAATYGKKMAWFDLARKAVTELHHALGGE